MKQNNQHLSRTHSLRFRLLISVIGVSILLWLISLAIMVYIAWNSTSKVFDDALKKSATILLQASKLSLENQSIHSITQSETKHELNKDDLHYQIIQNSRVISHTKGSPDKPFIQNFPHKRGFVNITLNDSKWRIYIIKSRHSSLEVQVGQALEMRTEILGELTEFLILPALFLLFLLGLISTALIYFQLRPLHTLAYKLTQKSPHNLEPLPQTSNSIELQAITDALNNVFLKLERALENERRFTADAAHELRTPLAALSMQTQLLQRQYPDLQQPLQKLRQKINRATRLVENLLQLARLDPVGPKRLNQINETTVNLNSLAHELMTQFTNQFTKKNITFKTEIQTQSIIANRELLLILFSNLIDNSIKYCSDNSTITFSAQERQSGHKVISVCDDGPGVSEEEIKKLPQRFYRILGNEETGSGLGLSIVQRIAELHHAHLEIRQASPDHGLCVEIIFINQENKMS